MKYPRSGILTLLVFVVLATALQLVIALTTIAMAGYWEWWLLVQACLKQGVPPPPFSWAPVLAMFSFFSISLMFLLPPNLAYGSAIAIWVFFRGHLPTWVVVASSFLLASGLWVLGDEADWSLLSSVSFFAVSSLACLWLLRRFGLPA